MNTETHLYSLALSHSLLSSGVLFRLVARFGSAQAAWNASERALKEELSPAQIDWVVQTRNRVDPQALWETYQTMGIQVLLPTDPDYPELLRIIHDPPFVLYVRGNLGALQQRTFAMVGTRRFSHYGEKAVQVLIEQIAPFRPCIVSGLATGIDTLSHQAALKHHLPTVAVFGTAIDQIYPKDNARLAQHIIEAGGALVSEYPVGALADRHTFPKRNRVIAGLCLGTLVVEGSTRSGALITARYALEENRQVFALPGNVFSQTALGPNQLIQQGAIPVLQGTDIVQAMGWQPLEPDVISVDSEMALQAVGQLTPPQQEVLAVVGYEPTFIEDIQAHLTTLSIQDLNRTLTALELQGFISALPGAKYCRN